MSTNILYLSLAEENDSKELIQYILARMKINSSAQYIGSDARMVTGANRGMKQDIVDQLCEVCEQQI
ncbi:hypothetical protein Y032_0146g2516 [Ancylostoma ceylanicum]|nr:hypothetical protein Y032_0146g2516 [Ancylostoma ceylanicum]